MSITWYEYRNGKNEEVTVEEFTNKEVIQYLTLKLNTREPRFSLVAKPKFCDVVMVRLDDVNFLVHARHTWIELSFDQKDSKKMEEVVETLKMWDKFSKTEKTFYVEINEGTSHTIIFENGYATCGEYRRHFSKDKIKITSFKSN